MRRVNYFALTIGPIYKTLAMARHTREIWAASYVFSWFIERLVEKLQVHGEIIMPVSSGEREPANAKAGLYPDRLILKLREINSGFSHAGNQETPDLQKMVEDAVKAAIEKIPGGEKDGEKFLLDYFQFYSLEISLPEQEDPIQTISPLLDSMEQKAAYVAEYNSDSLALFLKNIRKWASLESIFNGKRFPSVFEVAAQELKGVNDGLIPELIVDFRTGITSVFDRIFQFCLEHEDKKYKGKLVKNTEAIRLLKEAYKDQFRFHHKYMAIVQADGDNLSQALHAVFTSGNIKAVQSFSRFLMEFGVKAISKIEAYGGTPIYMGGDDLLFFAPVRNDKTTNQPDEGSKVRTVFHLAKELDELYHTMLTESGDVIASISEWNAGATEENRRKEVVPTLSFGISIGHYKYPLRESLETARSLLFDVAKAVPGKDALSFKVLKHSGQFFGATWQKHRRAYDVMLFGMMESPAIEDNFLTSLQHKLGPLRPVLYRILTGREIDPEKADFKQAFSRYLAEDIRRDLFIDRLMSNFFNELVHKKDGTREFLKLSLENLLQTYRDMEDLFGNSRETAEKAVDSLYATLRLIQFINQPDHNEQEEL
jgi:CRISPR-associated protein Cmr2